MNKAQVVAYFSEIISQPKKKVFDLVIFKGKNNRDYSLVTVVGTQQHIDRAQADLDANNGESFQMHVSGTQAHDDYMRVDPTTGLKATTHFNTNKDENGLTVDRISFHSERVASNPEHKGFRIDSKREEQPAVAKKA